MPFQTHLTGLESAFKTALGDDLSIEPQTEAGQMIAVMAAYFTSVEDIMAFLEAGLSVHTASGDQLLAIGSLTGIPPLGAEKSTVTLTLIGTSGTYIPSGVRVQNDDGVVFQTTREATIPSSGSIDVAAESVDEGAFEAAVGSLTTIVDPRAGWTATTNSAAATVGRAKETSLLYRLRFAEATRIHSIGYKESILSNIRKIDGVRRVSLFENATNASVTERGLTLPANTIALIVDGGLAENIYEAIRKTKPLGVGLYGLVISADDGVRFARPTDVPITATVSIKTDLTFPDDGESQVITALVDYVTALDIGDTIDTIKMTAAILGITGNTPQSLVTVARKSGSGDVTDQAGLGRQELITLADSDVTINRS